MTSLFYQMKFAKTMPVSFLVLERTAELVKQTDGVEGDQDEVFAGAVALALKECHGGEPTDEDVMAAAETIREVVEKSQAVQGKGQLPKKSKGFAADYMDWADKLEPAAICLIVANYDLGRAQHLYSKVDRSAVMVLIEQCLRHEWEKIKLNYESAVYAAGGSFKSSPGAPDDDPNTVTYDLTNANPQGMAALAKIL